MTARKWEELTNTKWFVYVAVAVVIAMLLGSKFFISGSTDASNRTPKQAILTGAHISTNRGYAGCRSVEDTDKFTSLLAANDTTAALAFIDQSDCRLMPEGTSGIVEELSVWHASVCIRQTGRPFCDWIPDAIATQVE